MKVFLMHRDHDFCPEHNSAENEDALTQDLELTTLFNAMACDDKFILDVASKSIFSSLNDIDSILYRQSILRDCIANSSIIQDIYNIAVESIEGEKRNYFGFLRQYPSGVLHRSVSVLQMLVGTLKKLKNISSNQSDKFKSDGFARLFLMIENELNNEYFSIIQNHLNRLRFHDGVLISAGLGKGNKGTHYVLRKSQGGKQNWITRIVERTLTRKPVAYTFHLHPRDESGAKIFSELKDKGINLVASALAQSTDHIISFFTVLRTELAFYIACLNLQRQLVSKGYPISFPVPAPQGELKHSFIGLYDVCLALHMQQCIVGNNIYADGKQLTIVTGANQGGKSTFLRSVGLAQLMMQCGMFVAAESFQANICSGLFTHFKREEDVTMKSGKLDEELSRMSDIADHVTSNAMILFNESFAATNEREGAEISKQIVSALLESKIKIFFVTHSYEFAHQFFKMNMSNAIFLKAERQADGERTFRILEGEPSSTSYGEDLYKKIFLESSNTVDK